MDALSRAAQFGAFAAVAGHYEALKERARYTEQWKPLEEDQREQLDRVFNLLRIHQQTHPIIKIEYFVLDTLKKGGVYKTNTERLQKLDEQKHKIILQDGMPINTNLCKNKFVKHKEKTIMLQATSIYTQGNGEEWDANEMFKIMLEISKTSLQVLGSEIFNQITQKNN